MKRYAAGEHRMIAAVFESSSQRSLLILTRQPPSEVARAPEIKETTSRPVDSVSHQMIIKDCLVETRVANTMRHCPEFPASSFHTWIQYGIVL